MPNISSQLWTWLFNHLLKPFVYPFLHGLEPEFDAGFYRQYYKDLAHLRTPSDLILHYLRHGRKEGRVANLKEANAEHDFSNLPPDFDIVSYKLLNPDLTAAFSLDLQYKNHYIKYGRNENRLFRVTSIRNNVREPWHIIFKYGDFINYAADWLSLVPENRNQAITIFAEKGIDRLTPINRSYIFDASFYRQRYQLSPNVSDADAYRDWLFKGVAEGKPPNLEMAISPFIASRIYPSCFDWEKYRARTATRRSNRSMDRVDALAHLFEQGSLTDARQCITGDGSGDLFAALGNYLLVRQRFAGAIKAYDVALQQFGGRSQLVHLRGDAHRALGNRMLAHKDFSRAAELPNASIWSFFNAAMIEAEDGKFTQALERLIAAKGYFAGSVNFQSGADRVIACCYDQLLGELDKLILADKRSAARQLAFDVLQEINDCQKTIDSKPIATPVANSKRVVLLANVDLRQCTHYRVEQKVYHFARLGLELEVFDAHEPTRFITALPGASAALFYRVHATPLVIQAIESAKTLGLPTFYDIDDLIFDEIFPDTFESYQGQITDDIYLSLQRDVPLVRFAMSLCDYGIASTAYLASWMEQVVSSGTCFVVPNALDERNDAAIEIARKRHRFEGRLTIFYGSGTKAHNQDFNDLIGPALLDILKSHDHVDVVIVGHLRLDENFDVFAERIETIEFIANLDTYWTLLGACDINLAALAKNPVADAKSEIKWLEAAMVGVPSVVSATATYEAVIEDGVDGILARDATEWRAALERLIADASLRRDMGAAARRKAFQKYDSNASALAIGEVMAASAAHAKSHSEDEGATRRSGPKILICNVFFSPQSHGGATRVVEANVDYLLEHCPNISLTILATDCGRSPSGSLICDSYRGISVYRFTTPEEPNMDWRPFNDDNRSLMNRVLDVVHPDIVHFHCIQRLTATIVEETQQRGIPYIVTVHDCWWISDFQFLMDADDRLVYPDARVLPTSLPAGVSIPQSVDRRQRLRSLLNQASSVVTVSSPFARLLESVGVQSPSVISNGLSKLPAAGRRPPSDPKLVLGHIGGRAAHKGAFLVESILRQNQFANLRLVMVDALVDYGQQIEQQWGETSVTLVGNYPQDKVNELYSRMDILLAPSLWPESYGLVAWEALSLGLWVVASDRGAIGEGIVDGENGFIVDVANPAGLTTTLAQLNADPQRYKQVPLIKTTARHSDCQGAELATLYERLSKANERQTSSPAHVPVRWPSDC